MIPIPSNACDPCQKEDEGEPAPKVRLQRDLNRAEDHQMMVGALNVLAAGGNTAALPVLREKAGQWQVKMDQPIDSPNTVKPIFYYSVLEIKAKRAIDAIEERCK